MSKKPARKKRLNKPRKEPGDKPMIVLGPGQQLILAGPIVLRGTLEVGPTGYVEIVDITPSLLRGKKRR